MVCISVAVAMMAHGSVVEHGSSVCFFCTLPMLSTRRSRHTVPAVQGVPTVSYLAYYDIICISVSVGQAVCGFAPVFVVP